MASFCFDLAFCSFCIIESTKYRPIFRTHLKLVNNACRPRPNLTQTFRDRHAQHSECLWAIPLIALQNLSLTKIYTLFKCSKVSIEGCSESYNDANSEHGTVSSKKRLALSSDSRFHAQIFLVRKNWMKALRVSRSEMHLAVSKKNANEGAYQMYVFVMQTEYVTLKKKFLFTQNQNIYGTVHLMWCALKKRQPPFVTISIKSGRHITRFIVCQMFGP